MPSLLINLTYFDIKYTVSLLTYSFFVFQATCSTLDFPHWIDKVYFLPMEVFWTHYKPRLFPRCLVPDRKSPNLLHTGHHRHIQILSDMSLKALNFPHQQSIWLVNQVSKVWISVIFVIKCFTCNSQNIIIKTGKLM